MRLPVIVFLSAVLCLPAYADGWRTYLQITCEPSIGHFSVRPTGTRNFNAPAPSGFIPIDRGTTQTENSGIVTEPGSDLFGRCELPGWDSDKKYAPMVFEVVRSKSWGVGQCSGCGDWSADFDVLVNGRRIATGRVGRADIPILDTIQFDSEELLMCSTSTAFSHRERDTNGQFLHTCKAGRIDSFPTR